MIKRVCLIHGLGGTPHEGWIPWLKERLEAEGYEVVAPQMPSPFMPKIQDWVKTIRTVVRDVDADTFFVGHSLGCLAILYFLESLPAHLRAGGAVFVAGTLALPSIPAAKLALVVKPWFAREKDYEKMRARAPRMVAILSDDDPLIPVSQLQAFADHLGAKTVLEHGQGHYSWLEGIREAPTVLDQLRRLAKVRARRGRRAIETNP